MAADPAADENATAPLQPHAPKRVRLFGPIDIQQDAQTRALPSGNASQLLAYLILHPRAHSRDHLIDILWQDQPPRRARRNFSDLLYRLRQELGEDWLQIESDTVAIAPHDLWVDVWEFDRLSQRNDPQSRQRLLDLYTAPLLPENYSDWILPLRVHYEEQFLHALGNAARAAEQSEQFDTALAHYRRLTEADPLREAGHSGLIRCLARTGRLPAALQVYERLQRLLENELGVAPSASVAELATHLRSEWELAQATPAPSHSLPFVGRVPQRQAVLAAAEAAVAGQGQLLALEGQPGIGKSRFLDNIRPGIEWRGATFLLATVSEQPSPSPYTPLAELLTAALAGPRAAQIESLLPAEILAACAPVYPAWAQRATLPDLPATAARQRFHHSLAQLMQALCQLAPHALALDDLHWAAPALWEALAALVRAVPDCGLLLLLSYRTDAVRQGRPWALLQEWEAAGLLHVWQLEPLSPAETAQLLPEEWQERAAEVHAAAGGNPFFIAEIVTAADTPDPNVSPSRAAAARAKALPPQQADALALAAVIGNRVPYRLWQRAAHLSPLALADAGERLCAQALLRPVHRGYEFVHDLIRTAVYDDLPPPSRQNLHQRVATALDSTSPDNLRLRAYHWDRAGAAATAAGLYARTGRQELDRFAFAEAEAAFARSLALQAIALEEKADSFPPEERLAALLGYASACDVTGARAAQTSALHDALALAQATGDDQQMLAVLVPLAELEEKTGRHPQAEAHLQQALGLAEATGDTRQALDIRLIAGDLALRAGETEKALDALNAALSQARARGAQQQEGVALEGLAWAYSHQNRDAAEIFACYEQALAVQRACGDELGATKTLLNYFSAAHAADDWGRVQELQPQVLPAVQGVGYRLGEGVARQTLGLIASTFGRYAEAGAHLAAARQIFQEVQDPVAVAIADANLGLVAQRRGDPQEAEACYSRSLRAAQQIGAAVFEAYALQDWGILLVEQQRHADAAPKLRQAIDTWQQSGERLNVEKCKAYLGLALLELGEASAAAELAQESLAQFRTDPPGGSEGQVWYWPLSQLLAAVGSPADAAELAQAAFDELLAQAQSMPSWQMRRQLLQGPPLNRQIAQAQADLPLRQQTVSLRVDPATGQPEGEAVTVCWTVQAPEDALLPDGPRRRRFVLGRLLDEAAAQGGLPTDDELATALDVSRRTVLRDRHQLSSQKAGEE